MEYNKQFQAVPSLVLKVAGICIFLPVISFNAYIFPWEKYRGDLLPFCQIFQKVIQQWQK